MAVTIRRRELWGFKGVKDQQCCVVSSGKYWDRPRRWGTVYLGVWGNGWTENEDSSFSTAFWGFSEKTIVELVDTKRLQRITINHENQPDPFVFTMHST
jgi:hypothetical protein